MKVLQMCSLQLLLVLPTSPNDFFFFIIFISAHVGVKKIQQDLAKIRSFTLESRKEMFTHKKNYALLILIKQVHFWPLVTLTKIDNYKVSNLL